jgi:hypothetical protein
MWQHTHSVASLPVCPSRPLSVYPVFPRLSHGGVDVGIDVFPATHSWAQEGH